MKGKCNYACLLFLPPFASTFPPLTFATDIKQPTGGSGISTCQFRTANYITHGLPQQCLRTSRVVATASLLNATDGLNAPNIIEGSGLGTPISDNGSSESPSVNTDVVEIATTTSINFVSKFERSSVSSSSAEQPQATEDAEASIDTANFLSFEEWKAQNLAKAGQSAENFGERQLKEPRRRPGSMPSALDALGEDAEIELNFGSSEGGDNSDDGLSNIVNEGKPSETVQPERHVRSKDAGKTCKERFNFASFDCAATVHKTNPESKGASAILVENKDSYMLNKCGAKKKFLIVELCDDILVDTVVLANYEFFSSMFRTFQVSVSDRYPVKSSGWKDLGVFEAKNSREIQAFLIQNPLIWARYIKIEFLTHYGKEFYCPISLLRVHGTTMMEEFRHQEELARGYNEDENEEMEPEAVAEVIEETVKEEKAIREAHEAESRAAAEEAEKHTREFASPIKATISRGSNVTGPALADPTNLEQVPSSAPEGQSKPVGSEQQEKDARYISSTEQGASSTSLLPKSSVDVSSNTAKTITTIPSSEKSGSKATKTSQNNGSHSSHSRETTSSRNSDSTAPESRPSSVISSAAPTPTTQESFFKTIHKRLQLLEANATLSLQYIEEQSRLMRDTFNRMEKRQFNKSAAYLEQLNATVLRELRGFREQYDQLWQSTVIALDTQRELSEREILAISARLTMLADEIVFQKRMTIAQSFLLLLIICLVVFSKTQSLDTGIVQTMFSSKSQIRLALESPPTSPSPPRLRPRSGRTAGHKKRLREYTHQRQDSSDMDLPTMHSFKRTPIPAYFFENQNNISTESISDAPLDENMISPPLGPQVVQSSPATPSGLNSLKKDIPWNPSSEGEYMTPDTIDGGDSRRRAASPLSNQVVHGDSAEGETEEETEEEIMEEELPETGDAGLESPGVNGDEGISNRNPYWASHHDDDGAVDSYFF